MDELKGEIAKNIFFYRKKRSLSRKTLAEKVGVTIASISHWENERNSIDIDTLYKVCLVLNVSMSDMFGAFAKNSEEVYSSYERSLIFDAKKVPFKNTGLFRKAKCVGLVKAYTMILGMNGNTKGGF